jgi:ketosteroid isomerase-like protein
MDVSRREVMVGGALALGVSGLVLGDVARADANEEGAVKDAVETLRKATFEADKAKLDQLLSPQVSYGHSSARVETKEQVIHGITSRKSVMKSLAFPDLTVHVVGNAAVARHIYLSESETDGKPTTTKIGVLAVWHKEDGAWKLLARQGFKLT